MRFLFTTPAETGHLIPMLGVARALADRGHHVVLHAPEEARRHVERAELPLIPHQTPDIFARARAGMARPQPGWLPRPLRGFVNFRASLLEWIPDLVRDLTALMGRENPDCLVAESFCWGARFAAERTGVPFATIGSSGIGAYGADGRPMLAPSPVLTRVPLWLLRALGDHLLMPVKRCRAALGLPRLDSMAPEFFGLMASPHLHLVPSHRAFIPDKPLGPNQVFIGPVPYSLPAAKPVSLGKLDPDTILVSTTTTGRDQGLLRRVLEAVAPLKRPVLATAASATDLPKDLGRHVRIEPFIPHEEVFPQVSTLITHGGWGTVGRGMRHGLPMLVVSIFGDQPATGARVQELGWAHHLRVREATRESIRQRVEELLADTALHARIRAVADELRKMDAGKLASEALEAFVRQGSRHPGAMPAT